jgi:putative DNA methylase
VRSPSPAFSHAEVPLVSTYILSSKQGKEAHIEAVVAGTDYEFKVRIGALPDATKAGTKTGGRGTFGCLLSGTPIDPKYIKAEGQAGRMGSRLLAIVAEGKRGRVYLSPTSDHEAIAKRAAPTWTPDIEFSKNSRHMTPWSYGLSSFADLFTPRQLAAMSTFSDLAQKAVETVKAHALHAGMADDRLTLEVGGSGATAYAQAVGMYLAFAMDKVADRNSSLCAWASLREHARNTFGRQALSMTWDFAESNPLSDSSGNFSGGIKSIADGLGSVFPFPQGHAIQADAQTQAVSDNKVVSTDPPYYDNVPYADLADFFYVWLRRSLRPAFPDLFATLAVPKAQELVADPHRHGGKQAAEDFFLDGMTRAVHNLAERAHPAFPVTVYYAFKQSETKLDGTTSSGWETFLEAVIRSGFAITGTWPINTELDRRIRGQDANALASSIVLVCCKRTVDAATISRRQLIRELNTALPEALLDMTRGGVNSPVAPVDLSQAIIGPGMAIFSQYAAVLEADGKPMSVRTALQLINRFFAEDDFDHDTQFCLHWFEGQGWAEGKFGEADVLARAKGTSVGGLHEAGVIESSGGKLRLLRWAELPKDWAPETDTRTPVWEALHQLIRALNQDSESAAGALLARMPARAEPIRALAYRLYTLCERKGWAEEARAYNELVSAWTSIEQSSAEAGILGSQAQLDI